MATPGYSGGSYYRRWGQCYRSGYTPGPTGNGWLARVGSWFGGATPQYAGQGQPTPGTVGSGTPVYVPAPVPVVVVDATPTTPQASSSVIVAPRG